MYPAMYMPQYQYQQRQEYMPQAVIQQPAQQSGNGMSVRPVASRAEAEAAQIPFDGTTHFFYDTSCGKLYSKTFNGNNGTAPLITFSRDREAIAPAPRRKALGDFYVKEIITMAETTTDYSAILEQLGLTTADAIKAWQREYGLAQTGEWGEAEQAAYDTYGSLPYKTADAIKQYQLSRGLDATGVWGDAENLAYRKDQAAGGVVTDVNSIVQRIMAEYDLPTTDTDTLRAQIEAYLRPSADQAIAARNKATAANRAAIDLDAYSRGMGASTWVTDAKQRETDSAQDDIGTIESNYMATLSEAILNQLNAAKNAQLTAQTNAYSMAAQLYQLGQNAAAGVGAVSSGGGGGGGYSYTPRVSSSGGSSGSSSSNSGGGRVYDSTNLTNDGSTQSFSNKDNLYNYLSSYGYTGYGGTTSSSSSKSSSSKKSYDSSTLSNSKWA